MTTFNHPTTPAPRSPSPTFPLMVDELDRHCQIGGRGVRESSPNVIGADKIKMHKKNALSGATVLGPMERHAATACPCCARYVVKDCSTADLSSPTNNTKSSTGNDKDQQAFELHGSLSLISSLSADYEDDAEAEADDRNDSLPTTLGAASDFTITSTIVQGWVHKKGTGRDLFGSRAWKSRWATLATASIAGYDVDVPVLLIYWFSSSDAPSTVLVLDPEKTIVMPVDRYNTVDQAKAKAVQWNTFTFEIVHSSSSSSTSQEDGRNGNHHTVTRAFCVPEKERSAWVVAINNSFRDYEQRLKKKRQDGIMTNGESLGRPQTRPPLSPQSTRPVLSI